MVILIASSLTKIVIGVVALVASAIKIIKELVVFIGYKASKLEVFRVTVTRRVGKSIKVIRQQR